jgi:hypothetical protein
MYILWIRDKVSIARYKKVINKHFLTNAIIVPFKRYKFIALMVNIKPK